MHPASPLAVIHHRDKIAAVLPALRQRILQHLQNAPDSATGLARKLRLPRQKVNYHVHELERTGFLELASEEQRRGCTERLFRPTARAYFITPELLGSLAADPAEFRDKFSSAYLLTLAARIVRDVTRLRRDADKARKPLATFALHLDVNFRSPADRSAFAEELSGAVARLTAKFHNDSPESRPYRFLIGGHPVPKDSKAKGGSHHAGSQT